MLIEMSNGNSSSSKNREDPLTRFIVGLTMLFISGVWVLISYLVAPTLEPSFLRQIFLLLGAFSVSSFLVFILIFFLDMIGILEEEKSRKAMAYTFAIGILLLIISIMLFTNIIATRQPSKALEGHYD